VHHGEEVIPGERFTNEEILNAHFLA